MLQRLRRGLSYSNVTATLALAIAMGGSAYALTKGEVRSEHIAKNAVKSKHIAKNAATGSDVKESSLKGIGAGFLGGQWGLGQNGFGTHALSALGTGVGSDAKWIIAPTDMKITDFKVRLITQGQAQGTRTFLVNVLEGPTQELCTIETGQGSCSSSGGVKVNAGDVFQFQLQYADSPTASDAAFGWRAITR